MIQKFHTKVSLKFIGHNGIVPDKPVCVYMVTIVDKQETFHQGGCQGWVAVLLSNRCWLVLLVYQWVYDEAGKEMLHP